MTHSDSRRAIQPLFNDNPLKLGVFAINHKGGAVMSTADGTHQGTWAEQPRIAQAADRAGFEFLLSVARWRTVGGASDFAGNVLETFTWAAAIAAITEQIAVITTAHVPIFHPLLAAKQGATIDQIANGRFGLNVVVGWNAEEFGMFGIEQLPHDERYAVGAEWVTVIKQLWESERVDFDGKYYTVHDGFLQPKPIASPRPVMVNAGQSPPAWRFAAEHMDFVFQANPDLAALEKSASPAATIAREEFDREVGVLAQAYVVCADTEREAQRYIEHYADEKGDYVASQKMIDLALAGASGSFPPEVMSKMQRDMVVGWGGHPLVGTPEQIVERIVKLHEIGISGIALTWLNYAEGIDQFTEQILPLLVDAGLRNPEPLALNRRH